MYELQGVIKAFGDGGAAIRAVDGVDLRINAGEFLVIEGPSGSGKSTLLQLLGALDRPTAGSVMFEGNDLALLPDRKLAELRLQTFGFIFQQFNLVPTLSAAENVETALAPLGGSRRERKERALTLLDGVGLRDRAHHLPSQLSGGEQQRVAIARALSKGPRVILADEPTGNLDTRTGAEIMQILRDLAAKNGQTVVLITHDPEIAAAAPRVVRVRDGAIVADGSGAELAATGPAAQLQSAAPVAAPAPTFPMVQTPAPAVAAPASSSADKWIETAQAPKHQGEELLHAEGVVKHYITDTEDVVGVDGVSIIVHEGEFVAITGPSGSGKTTLLNCLSGLDRIDRGRVLITGQTVHDLTDKEQSHLRSEVMGFIFQNWNLVPVFSAVENVELPLLLNGVKANEARTQAAATLERVGLGHRLDHHPNALSGGEQQRVAIARALAANPQLVWADEPTGNLDSHTAESVMELFRELNDDGLAVVIVTHDESIAETATRRIYMRDGRLLADMTRKDSIGRPFKKRAKPVAAAPAAPAKPQKQKQAKVVTPPAPKAKVKPAKKVPVPPAPAPTPLPVVEELPAPTPVPAPAPAPEPKREKKQRGRHRKQSFQDALREIRESTEAIGTLTPTPEDEPIVMPTPAPEPEPVATTPVEIPIEAEPVVEPGSRQHAMNKSDRRAARRASRMGYSAREEDPRVADAEAAREERARQAEEERAARLAVTEAKAAEEAAHREAAKQREKANREAAEKAAASRQPSPAELVAEATPEPEPEPSPEPVRPAPPERVQDAPAQQRRPDPSPQPRRPDPSPQPRQPSYQSPMSDGLPESVSYDDPF